MSSTCTRLLHGSIRHPPYSMSTAAPFGLWLVREATADTQHMPPGSLSGDTVAMIRTDSFWRVKIQKYTAKAIFRHVSHPLPLSSLSLLEQLPLFTFACAGCSLLGFRSEYLLAQDVPFSCPDGHDLEEERVVRLLLPQSSCVLAGEQDKGKPNGLDVT